MVPLREKGQDRRVSFTVIRTPPDILVTVGAESMVPGNISLFPPHPKILVIRLDYAASLRHSEGVEYNEEVWLTG